MLALQPAFRHEKDSKLSEADSFGLVGISSTGAILGVLITGLFIGGGKLNGALPEPDISTANLLQSYLSKLGRISWESLMTLLPIIATYVFFQIFSFKHKKSKVIDIAAVWF